MARKMRLTDRAISRLAAAPSEYTIWDTRIPGLGVRVRPSGHWAFVALDNRDGSSKRRTLGPATRITADEARSRCLDTRSGNLDPSTDARPVPVPLFGDFVADVWRSECFMRLKPSTRRSANSALANQLLPAFAAIPLDRIGRKDVTAWFDRYSRTAPGGANRVLDTLRQILNHAKVHGHLETNPASGLRRNPERTFNRFLSRDEARRLHGELDRLVAERPERAVQADIIRLLYLTGCRLSEIRTLKWSEVGSDTLDLADSKTGPRTVFLNAEARAIIARHMPGDSAFVFPSPRNPGRPLHDDLPLWYMIRREVGIEDVRLHDLRHTYASHAVMQGTPLPVVARLLGHSQTIMTLRYAHTGDRETEAAAERIGGLISGLLGRSPTA